MTNNTFDPIQYKAGQRQQWSDVATGWRRWWATIEKSCQPLSDRMLVLAEVQPSDQVLDIATGIGEPAITAARHVGDAGHVIALDIADQMLTIARERATELNLANITFLEADAETIDFAADRFDAILSRWGLMLLPDVTTTLRKTLAMLKPGGNLAAVVWDTPDQVPYATVLLGTAAKMFNPPPPPPGTPTLFGLAGGVLEAKMAEAGFQAIKTEKMQILFEFPSVTDYCNYFKDIAAPLAALLARQSPADQERFWQTVVTLLDDYTTTDGRIQIPGTAICAVGQK